jgi:ribonuclease BN (tRNA processing enzyme)
MPTVTFFPLGNADGSLITLDKGKRLLFDFGSLGDAGDASDLRIDLVQAVRDDLRAAKRTHIDVVAFTHLDRDHIARSTDFFWLEHAAKYQSDDRFKISELWVPAAAIVDDQCEDEAKILQAEARYRLKEGHGIKVFSRPDMLKDWFEKQGLGVKDRLSCIVDAGTVVPSLSLGDDGVEFFVHSPFGQRLNDAEVVDRNKDAIMVQATFVVDGVPTKLIFGSDIPWNHLQEIVEVTRAHRREERLEWDIFHLPHHCSYLSLSDEKGTEKTTPVAEIAWLYEAQARKGAILVSPSWPIPSEDTDQPPHRQAAAYYRSAAAEADGQFIVTMEHPSKDRPKPLVITIDRTKAFVSRPSFGVPAVVSSTAHRAG